MNVSVTPFLRNALLLDAVASGATALLAIVGAPLLAPLLGLPQDLLFWAGVVLVPFVAFLLITARRQAVARLALIDIIGINALWVAASLGLLVSGLVSPNALGVAFVVVQAVAVALFAELQFIGLRRATAQAA
ncbi:hypothetical protein C7441_103154 [Pseudaminobacter salicylatoxidans]|uniref:Uncharacterized protein n=1 Tax=Pseudaminobacter salicylatoxidans TaxID=93369 RepID=A0A316C719_PSESE|nr:hypothetical protein [Pseudaminobacter salicylatoxidans]PWJ85298.1 hypothetical protein C7441_103154 [Pseudaminobacter salicylatoxidans]